MNPWDIIAKLEQTSGKKDKAAILLSAVQASPDFVKGAHLAYNPFINFGVRKIPTQDGKGGKGLPFSMFADDVQKLVTRQITGNAAKELIDLLMMQATAEQWNGWYRRILMKDFKAGVDTSINKALKAAGLEEIPEYSCQLAYAIKDKPKAFKGKVFLETKYDGARLNLYGRPDGKSPDQQSYVLSREGRPLYNFVMLEDQLRAVLADLKNDPDFGGDWMFDGEVVSAAFYQMMRQFKRKHDTGVNDATLLLFDMVPAKHIDEGTTYRVPLRKRKEKLALFFERYGDRLPNFGMLDYVEVDLDTPEGRQAYREFNATQVENAKTDKKVEGTMTKDAEGFYNCKRTTDWLKEKPYIEVTLTIVGIERGKEDTKNSERLGGLLCSGFDLGKQIEVTVGGGYSDEERDWIFENFEDHVKGHLIEVQADNFTEKEGRPGIFSLRFPVMKGFRGFTPGQKI